jgi:IS1 family transposase/transposase-like protein
MKEVKESEIRCRKCGSTEIIKNGHNDSVTQQYHCQECQWYGILEPKVAYTQDRKEEIIRAYQERASMRGIERIFGVSRQTLAKWIKNTVEQLPAFADTLQPCQPDDVIEYDELWSFDQKKDNQSWLWAAICRRTRQIVGFALGERNFKPLVHLLLKMPLPYFLCRSVSDFWSDYRLLLHNNTCVPKQSGETAHIERWNNTLRQRLGRYVRKTLSFSKSAYWHELVTKLFITNYNLSLQS